MILWIFYLREVFGCWIELMYCEIIGNFTPPSCTHSDRWRFGDAGQID